MNSTFNTSIGILVSYDKKGVKKTGMVITQSTIFHIYRKKKDFFFSLIQFSIDLSITNGLRVICVDLINRGYTTEGINPFFYLQISPSSFTHVYGRDPPTIMSLSSFDATPIDIFVCAILVLSRLPDTLDLLYISWLFPLNLSYIWCFMCPF